MDSTFRINVEGVLTVSGTPNSSTRWLSGTKTVTVNDGRLTVSNGSGAKNNKICFIDITPVASGAPFVAASAPIVEVQTVLNGITRDAAGKVTLRLTGMNGADYAVEASSDLKHWEAVAVAPNLGGTLSFIDPIASSNSQRFYRVRLNR